METNIREFPTKDVGDIDNSLGFGAVLGFCNVGLKTSNGFYTTLGSTLMNLAAHAAGGDANACRHGGMVKNIMVWIEEFLFT